MIDYTLANRNRIILASILLGGLALRLINLGGRNLWYDEAFAVLYAEKSFGAILYGTVTPVGGAAADVHPLLYYFFLHIWMGLFGQSPFVVRLPSVIFGLGTIVLTFLIGRELFDWRTGLLAALMAAVAPFHVNYSQEARMYSLLCFLSLLSAFFFVRCWADAAKPGEPSALTHPQPPPSPKFGGGRGPVPGEKSTPEGPIPPPAPRPAAQVRCWRRGGWGNGVGFILATTLSLYTHNLAFLNLLALDLFVLIARRWRLLKSLILAQLIVALLFAPWLSVIFSQFGKVQQSYWVPRPGLAELINTVVAFTFNLPTCPPLLPVVLFLSLAILVLALYRVFRTHPGQETHYKAVWLLLLMAFAPIIVAFLVSQFRPVYIIRGLLPAALAYYLLLAWVVSELKLPRWGWVLIASIVAVPAALSLGYHYQYAQFPRPPFVQAVAYLREHYRPGDAIVHDNKLTFFPCHYYDRELPQTFIADPPGSGSDTLALPTQEALGLFAQELEAATTGHERVWLVIFDRAVMEYQAAGYPDHPHLSWLKARYRLGEVIHFNDLAIYRFQSLAEESHG